MKRLILLIVAALSVSGCMCSEKQIVQSESPNRKYIATFFERNCGATSGYVYHVNLKEKESWLIPSIEGYNEDGQIFVGDGRRVDLIWKDEKTLLIKCNDCAADSRIHLENTWKDVSISYQSSQKLN